MDEQLVKDDKKLSNLLRHCPESYGCTTDKHGWADMVRVVKGICLSHERIAKVVSQGRAMRSLMMAPATGTFAHRRHRIQTRYGCAVS